MSASPSATLTSIERLTILPLHRVLLRYKVQFLTPPEYCPLRLKATPHCPQVILAQKLPVQNSPSHPRVKRATLYGSY